MFVSAAVCYLISRLINDSFFIITLFIKPSDEDISICLRDIICYSKDVAFFECICVMIFLGTAFAVIIID